MKKQKETKQLKLRYAVPLYAIIIFLIYGLLSGLSLIKPSWNDTIFGLIILPTTLFCFLTGNFCRGLEYANLIFIPLFTLSSYFLIGLGLEKILEKRDKE